MDQLTFAQAYMVILGVVVVVIILLIGVDFILHR
jgi:preprotein translocase subunit SecE